MQIKEFMSKLKVELMALADYALTAEDKKLSVMGIFDKVFVKQVPASHPRLSFVVTISGEVGSEEKLTLRVVAPSDKDVFKAETSIRLGENGKANMISNFEGFPLTEVGIYRFLVEKQGKEVGGYNLEVILVKDNKAKGVN